MKRIKIPILILLVSLLIVGIVDADAAPVAAFSANVTTGCAPLHVAFTDATTRTPISWGWYWFANETRGSTLQNPTNIFQAGTYSVRLYACSSTHCDWENKSSYIATTGSPVAAFSGTPTSGTAPLSVQFNDTSTNSPDNWDWYWGADETKGSDTRNASNSFATGTYNVRLYVSNCGGAGSDWENKTGYITSNAPAADPFDASQYNNWTDVYVNSTSALTDYQVSIILDNRTGSSTTGMFYTNGTTRATWEDIAWTDTSNATLGFWKENRTDTATNTTWWIKVPSIANDNTTKIRLFYGNTSKTKSYADMENTFIFSDDFNEAAINTTKWTINTTPTVANSILTIDTASKDRVNGKIAITGGSYAGKFRGAFTNPTSWTTTTGGFWDGGANPVTMGSSVIIQWTGSAPVRKFIRDDWGATTTITLDAANHTFDIKHLGTTSSTLFIDGGQVAQHTTGLDTNNKYWVFGNQFADDAAIYGGMTADWVLVRKIAAVEPFLTLVSSGGAAPPSAPVASFTVNRNPARIPQSITVTDTSTNIPTSWAWSWGDGTANSTTQNPTHQYTKRGRWNIILTATNAGGSGTNSANYVRVVGYENNY